MKKRASKSSGKYSTQDHYFDKKHGVLINKLGIKSPHELELQERQTLLDAYDQSASFYSESHTFRAKDISALHKLFLGDVYDWAGEYRTVDLSSENIRWCHAKFIENEMQQLDKLLQELTPLRPELSQTEILERIAKIHGELIVIHPFRDGNGRVTRLLCNLLLMQAEREAIQQTAFYDDSHRLEYHEAIQSVWKNKDYDKLIAFLARLIYPQ